MKIAIQGETGCFHEVAARQYFNYDEIEIVPCTTFDMTLMTLIAGEADFAVMAIENARSGSILYNYTLIRESGMKILGEHNLRIKQNLMALKGQQITDIKEIRSHPIALAQCMTFLNQFPGITLIESDDTAASARVISENKLKGVAAIAPSHAAEIYDLKILASGIETYKQNYTRFLIVGSEDKGNTKGNKVSICFSTGHKPGSLAAVLVKLAEHHINLSKIQSVPRLNGEWEYMFYCDLELDKNTKSEVIKRVLEQYTSNLRGYSEYFIKETCYMRVKPANRISKVEEYYFSQKLAQIDRMRREGADIINLGIGSPDQPPSENTVLALTAEAGKSTSHGYQSYTGIPALRKAFADWYKKYFHIDLNPDNEILILMGSKEGIMHLSMAFVNPGDEVLIPDPGYPTYTSVTNLVGGVVRKYDLVREKGWYPDLEALEQTDLSRVKLMWTNYPNMPTGTKGSVPLFEKLVAFSRKHGILLCNDNPYSFILNKEYHSILEISGARETVLELNSLSKSHNMAGWRIGMIAGDNEYIKEVLKVKSNMDSGMFLAMQMAAVEALNNPETWYKSVNAVYGKRRKIVEKIIDLLDCRYDKSQVGLFVWARIPDEIQSCETYVEEILNKTHVFITPGFIFGANGDRYIRISLCATEEKLNEALERLMKLK